MAKDAINALEPPRERTKELNRSHVAEVQEYALVTALEAADRPEPTQELAETVAQLYESQFDAIDAKWQRRVR